MFGFFKKKKNKKEVNKEITLYAVADGELISIEDVSDLVFAQKMMGDGYAIVPTNGQITAPVEGVINNVFPTKHAVGFTAGDLEVLLHMGIDTVALDGRPFNTDVNEGQSVDASSVVSQVDLEMLEQEEKDNAMMVIFTNGADVIESFEMNTPGPVKAGDVIGKIILK